jgi:hypothetical protein
MRFTIASDLAPMKGVLSYVAADDSFFFAGGRRLWHATVTINYLQLHCDPAGRVLYADGYAPRSAFLPTGHRPPPAQTGGLFAPDVVGIPAGVAVDAHPGHLWPMWANATDGSFAFGDPTTSGDDTVEFATGCIAVVDNSMLSCLWLRPVALSEA